MDFKVILSELFVSDLKEIVATLAARAGLEVARRIGNELLDQKHGTQRAQRRGEPRPMKLALFSSRPAGWREGMAPG